MKKVIIIGSGFGGLLAGNLLVQKGHKVTIFESHNLPGGYTAGFNRNGFYFESGTFAFESSASIFKAMKDIGLSGKMGFERSKTMFISDDINGIPEKYDDFKKMFYDAFAADKDQLDNFFVKIDKVAGAFAATDRPMPHMYKGLALFLAIIPYIISGPKYMNQLKEYQNLTVAELLERYFIKDSKLFRRFNSFGYPDMEAVNLVASLAGMFTDNWTVKTGMQSWANLLTENFRKFGGEMKLNSYVERIITKDGAAVGVSCKNTDYYADYIISAGDYKKTFLELLDNPDLILPELKEKIKNASTSQGFFTVYLGLNMTNDNLRKYMSEPHVIFFDQATDYDIYNSTDERFFDKTRLTLYSPSLNNPELAPAGKSSLMIQAAAPHRWMDNWGNGDKTKYKQLKEQAMKSMVKKAAKVISNLENSIEYQDAATPLTYERFTHNTDGASSAWNWDPKERFYDQPMSVNVETPVKNLMIGSCWAMQIGGIPGALAAAYQCAMKVR